MELALRTRNQVQYLIREAEPTVIQMVGEAQGEQEAKIAGLRVTGDCTVLYGER